MDASESKLITAALEGDSNCFESVISKHSRTLFAVAFAVLQDSAEAEDVVQDTFVRAWRKRRWIRDPEKFPAWLTAVARNRACDILRKRRTVPLAENCPEIIESRSQDPADPTHAEELHDHVRTAIARLPEQHRTAVTLRYMQGMDYVTIERTMGISNGALRGILGRSLASMRKLLKTAVEACE